MPYRQIARATPIVAALQRETSAIPIVFAAVADPLGSGFIASLPQPGGNITGVMLYEPSVTGKWLSMLKEIAPQLVRAAFLINPRSASFYNYYLRTAEPLSRSLGIDLVPTLVANTAEMPSRPLRARRTAAWWCRRTSRASPIVT